MSQSVPSEHSTLGTLPCRFTTVKAKFCSFLKGTPSVVCIRDSHHRCRHCHQDHHYDSRPDHHRIQDRGNHYDHRDQAPNVHRRPLLRRRVRRVRCFPVEILPFIGTIMQLLSKYRRAQISERKDSRARLLWRRSQDDDRFGLSYQIDSHPLARCWPTFFSEGSR